MTLLFTPKKTKRWTAEETVFWFTKQELPALPDGLRKLPPRRFHIPGVMCEELAPPSLRARQRYHVALQCALATEAANDKKVYDAVRSDDAELLQELIDSGASLEAVDSSGYTPLLLAAVCGSASCVPVLVNGGANLSAREPKHRYSFMHLAAHYSTECLEAMLDVKPDIDCNSNVKHVALKRRSMGLLEKLVLEGVDDTLQEIMSQSPLDYLDPVLRHAVARRIRDGKQPIAVSSRGRTTTVGRFTVTDV